ncbi:MAG TPA: hypothetical protein VK071_05640 [Tissierellales bacterium]|nr:hypothetical protein [Tissierellales bacterium]
MKTIEGFAALLDTGKTVLPITLILILFQVLGLRKPIRDSKEFIV